MSKNAKEMQKMRRRNEKAKRKAANSARYDSIKGTAANRKKKSGSDGGSKGPKWCRCHATTSCGNIGCKRCFPNLERAF